MTTQPNTPTVVTPCPLCRTGRHKACDGHTLADDDTLVRCPCQTCGAYHQRHVDDSVTNPTNVAILALSRWIDEHPLNANRDPEAATWGRVAKIQEEAGEAIAALIGATGQNPRKGYNADLMDVRKELLDVALTALGAVAHLSANEGDVMALFAAHVSHVAQRAGV